MAEPWILPAYRHPQSGRIFAGITHHDVELPPGVNTLNADQGFLTHKGHFLNRQRAYAFADKYGLARIPRAKSEGGRAWRGQELWSEADLNIPQEAYNYLERQDAKMASNPLTAPSGPSPWGAPGGNVVPRGTPRIGNALVIPRTPPVPAAPVAPVSGAMQPGVQAPEAPPPAVENPLSERVMVPKADFPEEHHKHIHDNVMGEEFDKREAKEWVQHVYPVVRQANPNIDPRHVLEATRDAYYAVKHGFATNHAAGYMVGHHARRRHAEAQRREAERPVRAVMPMF